MKIFKLVVALLLLFQTQAFYKPELTGERYQSQSASDKFYKIQAKINSGSQDHASFFTLKLAEIFIQDNNLSFDTVGDDMPIQGIPPFRGKRDKLIHPVGLVAECTFESNGKHDYTGIFKGAENAFVRFSLAAQPDEKAHQFTPGFVFKFLVDGQPSANLFTMYSLLGQDDSSNIFQHDMTSHVPMINDDAPLPLKVLDKNFLKSSDYPVFLGLSHAAIYDQEGNLEKDPQFPFRIQLHPSKEAKESMKGDLKLTEYFFIDAMDGVQIEGTLFDVYAQAEPYSDLELIGSIKMTTAFQTSYYADQTLFFQHQRFEDDLALRPEWKQPTEDIIADQANTYPPYHYPDVQ